MAIDIFLTMYFQTFFIDMYNLVLTTQANSVHLLFIGCRDYAICYLLLVTQNIVNRQIRYSDLHTRTSHLVVIAEMDAISISQIEYIVRD